MQEGTVPKQHHWSSLPESGGEGRERGESELIAVVWKPPLGGCDLPSALLCPPFLPLPVHSGQRALEW